MMESGLAGEAQMQGDISVECDEVDIYRYSLSYRWDEALPILPCCMCNPSHGNASASDRTLDRLRPVVERNGFGGMHIVNLYALKATKTDELFTAADRVGPRNADAWDRAFELARMCHSRLLVAWGDPGSWWPQANQFVARANKAGITLESVGITRRGNPYHPSPQNKHWRLDALLTEWRPYGD